MMWLLNFIPDGIQLWVVNAMLWIGIIGIVIGFVIKSIPFINSYRSLIQVISIVLLVGGVYFKGGYAVEAEWQARTAEQKAQVLELEKKVKISEAKSKETNTVIQKEYIDRVEVVKEIQTVVKERIKVVEKLIDAECVVNPEAISILNTAATFKAK